MRTPSVVLNSPLVREPLSIDTLGDLVKIQADTLFPRRTDSSMFFKLYAEIGELVDCPDSPGEVADLFILLLDHAKRKNINIQKAVIDKMIVNDARTWVPGPMGVMSHVE